MYCHALRQMGTLEDFLYIYIGYICIYEWKLSSMQQLAAGVLSRHPTDCGMRSTVLGCLDTGTECHCQQASMCTAAGMHFSSRPTDLGSTPLGNMEKSVRAVNTLATSETGLPNGTADIPVQDQGDDTSPEAKEHTEDRQAATGEYEAWKQGTCAMHSLIQEG